MSDKQWMAAKVGSVIVALQHHCGVQNAPVNCYIDQRGNWECPNCMTTYGAAVALPSNAWTIEYIMPDDEEDE